MWVVQGSSGLGKTALLENWVKYTLERDKTPIYIPLGSSSPLLSEISSAMAQYGEVDVTPDVSADLIRGGGFVIFLDGFNEDKNPEKTLDFVRRAIRRNHVIITSQFTPKWENSINIEHIKLEPFGREQLKQIIEVKWVDVILSSEYLKSLASLPQTARLVAKYIHINQKLPGLRLDIYRNLIPDTDSNGQILNLELLAWNLFKVNKREFDRAESNYITQDFFIEAQRKGIFTEVGSKFRFRHDLINQFFTACYLFKQPGKALEEWGKEVSFGRDYWRDIIEFLSELQAEAVINKQSSLNSYINFIIKDAAPFSKNAYRFKIYPQVTRFHNTKLIEFPPDFFKWSSDFLAE